MLGWILCIVFMILSICLMLKIQSMKRSMEEICADFEDHLSGDTNTLITVSSEDRQIRKLAGFLNEQLKKLRQDQLKYEKGDRDLKDAAANISHDLRTPLTAICGYLDLIRQEEKSECLHGYLCNVENRVMVMKDLTEELFNYSLFSSMKEMRLEKVCLIRELEDCLLSFYGAMQEQGITPDINLPDEEIWGNFDKEFLNRIFSNLISNGIKYSDGDFKVCMTSDGCITFCNSTSRLTAVDVARLFDRYYTVHNERNATGLGLSIAKVLTERMGGTIKAELKENCLYLILRFEIYVGDR